MLPNLGIVRLLPRGVRIALSYGEIIVPVVYVYVHSNVVAPVYSDTRYVFGPLPRRYLVILRAVNTAVRGGSSSKRANPKNPHTLAHPM